MTPSPLTRSSLVGSPRDGASPSVLSYAYDPKPGLELRAKHRFEPRRVASPPSALFLLGQDVHAHGVRVQRRMPRVVSPSVRRRRHSNAKRVARRRLAHCRLRFEPQPRATNVRASAARHPERDAGYPPHHLSKTRMQMRHVPRRVHPIGDPPRVFLKPIQHGVSPARRATRAPSIFRSELEAAPVAHVRSSVARVDVHDESVAVAGD